MGAEILTLEEVFSRFGQNARYYLETNSPQLNPGVEAALVKRLEAFDMINTGRVLIQSFEQESLLKIHELNDDIPLIQLVWYSPSTDVNVWWSGEVPRLERRTSPTSTFKPWPITQ